MGLATEILTHVDNHIVHYAAEKSQAVAALIEPAVIAGISIYLLVTGYAHFKGEIEQPFMAFVDSVVRIVAITGIAFTAGTYNAYIITTFQDSPAALAAALSGATSTASATLNGSMGSVLDTIFDNCFEIGLMFWNGPGLNIDGYLVGSAVILAGLAVAGYAVYLVVLSKVITGLALAVGPLCVSALLWKATQSYFSSFLNMLINFGLVGALAVGATSLILSMFQQTAADVAALGATAKIADLGAMFLSGFVGVLVLMQVRNLASGLAGGVSLETFGVGRATAKMTGRAFDRVTGGRERDHKRAATDQHAVERHKKVLVKRDADEAKKRNRNEIKDGTNG